MSSNIFKSKTFKRAAICFSLVFGVYEAHRFHSTYEALEKFVYLPLSRQLDGETSHKLALLAVKWHVPPYDDFKSDALKTNVFGMEFDNPIGLAAGFDKEAEAVIGCQRLGFGYLEIGSVTPLPQYGNEKPRVFKLNEDRGIINRYGFPSMGHQVVKHNLMGLQTFQDYKQELKLYPCHRASFEEKLNLLQESVNKINSVYTKLENAQPDDPNSEEILIQELEGMGYNREDISIPNMKKYNSLYTHKIDTERRLDLYKSKNLRKCPIGVNIGVNKTSTDPVRDYVEGFDQLGLYSDYMVVNVSSPNTPGLRQLQNRDNLEKILTHVSSHKQRIQNQTRGIACKALFIKIAPDLSDEQLVEIIELVADPKFSVDGLIISNTTISRPETLISDNKVERGGLSGKPLKNISTEMIRKAYALSHGKVKIIGVGGIQNAEDAYEKIKAGASLVQLYSGIVYEGLGSIRRMKQDLVKLLECDGFANVEEAVGVDNKLPELPIQDGNE